ncbi:MAG: 23S rRNA (adenine(2503)-C(2))-methyltransferase RlmN [Bacteroidales bacterium]
MSGETNPDIRALTKEEIEHFFVEQGDKKFRAGQVYAWLWQKGCRSFDEMTNLNKTTRQLLKDHFTFHSAAADSHQVSSDGTIKIGFRLHDGLLAEGVLIPADDRVTACISSQVGCALGCKFCATGLLGFKRNLTAGEIVDQVTGIQHPKFSGEKHLTNIVFMGMGEPFLNYENVLAAIKKITSAEGLGMSPQRITVSSVGIPKMIKKMADDDPKYHFALSLHAATDVKRNQIIPYNLKHPLKEIVESLKYYHQKTGKRITIEYILFGNFNDSIADAKDLAALCRNFPVKINIIEYNPVKETPFVKSHPENTKAFVAFLEKHNMVVNVRKSRGKDIDAACGQLAGKHFKS